MVAVIIKLMTIKCINFEIGLDADARNQFYENLFCSTDLLLRDVRIKKRKNNI